MIDDLLWWIVALKKARVSLSVYDRSGCYCHCMIAHLHCKRSDRNPLDLIERDFVAGAVVELATGCGFLKAVEFGRESPWS